LALAAALADADPQVRGGALQSLRNLGPRAAGAIPALKKLAEEDPRWRENARETIKRIESGVPPASGSKNTS
jgi:hypothetical protein